MSFVKKLEADGLNVLARAKHFLHRKFDGYSIEEYMIMIVVSCIYLPFYCSLIALVLVLLYLLYKGRIKEILAQYPASKVPLIFSCLTGVVSILYKNYLGAVCALGLFVVFLFVYFFRSIISKRLFELIVDASCIVSLFCFGWALLEYYSIIQSLDYEFFDLTIADDPYYRVNSTFFNANYYAMMVEFLILMCVYKMMDAKTLRRIVFYVVTIFCNLIGLYLSGCRTAWIPFIITVPLMFLLNNHKKFFVCTIAVIVCAAGLFLFAPDIFPRSDSFGLYLDTRVDIWQAAIRGIMDHPLLGQGPLTYFHAYAQYGGPPTQHAHSVFLDPFLSFGILGVGLIGMYFYQNGKEIWHLYSQKLNVRLFSLIISFILTVLIHGLLDYTIFWVQTGQIFLLVLAASSMYTNTSCSKQT